MTSKGAPNSRGGSWRGFTNSEGGGVVGEVLRIRGGGGGSRRGFRFYEFERGGSRRGFTNSRGGG